MRPKVIKHRNFRYYSVLYDNKGLQVLLQNDMKLRCVYPKEIEGIYDIIMYEHKEIFTPEKVNQFLVINKLVLTIMWLKYVHYERRLKNNPAFKRYDSK